MTDYWARRHAADCTCGCNAPAVMQLKENPKTLVSILGGFLGAGKTTTLNHMLSQSDNRSTEIIVREFGEISVDHKLIHADEKRIHHFNGASLHVDPQTMLTNFIENLYSKKAMDSFDQLIIEASGADSAEQIAQIFYLPRSRGHYALGNYICVVDGEFGSLNLHEFRVAREQVSLADYLIVNKCDLVEPEALEDLIRELRIINPFAEIIRTSFGQVDADALLVADSFEQLHNMQFQERGQRAVEDFKSISIRVAEPLDRDKTDQWIRELYDAWGKKMLRGKGYFNIAGSDYRFDFQSVRQNFHAKTEMRWSSDEERESVLVFIGTELPDQKELEESLLLCRAPESPLRIQFGR